MLSFTVSGMLCHRNEHVNELYEDQFLGATALLLLFLCTILMFHVVWSRNVFGFFVKHLAYDFYILRDSSSWMYINQYITRLRLYILLICTSEEDHFNKKRFRQRFNTHKST